jgi:uncharacterized iron-regulated membrane protein
MPMSEQIRPAAIGFTFAAICALHPALWRWMQRSERKARERPVWRRVSRAVLAGVLVMFVDRFFEEMREELEAGRGCG